MVIFKIKEILKDKKITLTQMAKDIDVSRQSLSAIANNSVSMVSLETLDKISNYLETPISRIIIEQNNLVHFSVEILKNKIEIQDNSAKFVAKITSTKQNDVGNGYLIINWQSTEDNYAVVSITTSSEPNKVNKESKSNEWKNLIQALLDTTYAPFSNYIFTKELINQCSNHIIQNSKDSKKAISEIIKNNLQTMKDNTKKYGFNTNKLKPYTIFVNGGMLDSFSFNFKIQYGFNTRSKDFEYSIVGANNSLSIMDDKINERSIKYDLY